MTAKVTLEKLWNYRERLPDFARLAFNLANARWRLRGCTLGPSVQVMVNPRIQNWGDMVLHEKVIVDSITARAELVCHEGARLEIGERTYINYGTSISAHQSVKIGKLCRIGTYCNIAD